MDDYDKRFHGIPYEAIASYLNRLPKELPIVSVGCGPGTAEWKLQNQFGVTGRTWFLVDPHPESFEKYPTDGSPEYQRANVDRVKTLLNTHSELVDNCVLFLPWPSPNDDSGCYDVEAVMLLRPKAIVIVYESVGYAGSSDMHAWLKTLGESEMELFRSKPEMDYMFAHLTFPPLAIRYVPRMRHISYYEAYFGRVAPRLLLLQLETEEPLVVNPDEVEVVENVALKSVCIRKQQCLLM